MPACLRCTKETDQRCAACESSHYCTEECQRADWHAVHRYECRHYRRPAATKLGAVVDGVRGDDAAPAEEQRGHAKKAALVFEHIDADRREYDRVVSATRLYMSSKRQQSKYEMSLTHQQRALLARKLALMINADSADEQRARQRNRLIDTVQQIIAVVNQAGAEQGGALGTVQLDEAAMGQMAALFRKYDVLHQKQLYALATRRPEDQAAASRYHVLVDEEERRFVHSLLLSALGGGEALSYKALQRHRQREERAALAAEYAQNIMKDAVDHTVAVAVRYLEAKDRQARHKGHFGVKIKGDTGADDERRVDEQVIDKVEAAQGDTVDDAYSMARLKDKASAFIGIHKGVTDEQYKRGQLSKRKRDGSQEFVRGVWEAARGSLELTRGFLDDKLEVLQRQGDLLSWRNARGYWKQLYDKMCEHYGLDDAWARRLKMNSVWSIFGLIVLFTFGLMALGTQFFGDPLTPEMRDTMHQVARESASMEQLAVKSGAAVMLAAKLEGALQHMGDLVNSTSEGPRQFMTWNVSADSFHVEADAVVTRLMVDTTLGGLLEIANEELAVELKRINETLIARGMSLTTQDYGKPLYVTKRNLENVIELIRTILQSPSLAAQRDNIEDLQNAIRSFATLTDYMGESVRIERVAQMIDQFKGLSDALGLEVRDLRRMLTEEQGQLAEWRDSLRAQRDAILQKRMDAPVLHTLLERAGEQFGLAPPLVQYMASWAGAYGIYKVTSGQAMYALYPFARAEALFHGLVEEAGVRTADNFLPWGSSVLMAWHDPGHFLQFWAASAATFAMAFQLMPLVNTSARFVARRLAEKTVELAMDARLRGGVPLDPDSEDYREAERAYQGISSGPAGQIVEIMKRGDSVEQHLEAAIHEYTKAESPLTDQQYGILLELIRQRRPTETNVWMNRVGATLDAMGAAVHLVGVLVHLALQINYYWKIAHILYFFISALCSNEYLWLSLTFVYFVLTWAGHNIGLREKLNNPYGLWELCIGPFDALWRFFAKPDLPKTMLVNAMYLAIGGASVMDHLTFANFTERFLPSASAERLALRETAEILARNATDFTEHVAQANNLTNRTGAALDNLTRAVRTMALVTRGSNADVNALEHELNNLSSG
jgi:hypothetical protein